MHLCVVWIQDERPPGNYTSHSFFSVWQRETFLTFHQLAVNVFSIQSATYPENSSTPFLIIVLGKTTCPVETLKSHKTFGF